MPLENLAEDYFSNLNSMASRMYVDMNETKSAYEDLWHKIPEEEQKQILSETIIKPEVSVKYKPASNDIVKDFAVKFVIDDSCSYRDEHSAPFTFKTRSQRDLTLFETGARKQRDQCAARPTKAAPKPKRISLYLDEPVELKLVVDESGDSALPKTGLDFLDNW